MSQRLCFFHPATQSRWPFGRRTPPPRAPHPASAEPRQRSVGPTVLTAVVFLFQSVDQTLALLRCFDVNTVVCSTEKVKADEFRFMSRRQGTCSKLEQAKKAMFTALGRGGHRSVSLVITPSVPSEPMKSCGRP